MTEFVGVMSALNYLYGFLKKEALIFNRIAVPFSHILHRERNNNWLKYKVEEFEWLIEKGIAFDPGQGFQKDLFKNHDEYHHVINHILRIAAETRPLKEEVNKGYVKGLTEVENIDKLLLGGDYHSRAVSIVLRENRNIDAVPILMRKLETMHNSSVQRSDVVNIILNNLPIPHDSVSWEQIIDFKKDPDSISKFLALRNWMSEVVRVKLTPIEVEDKIEYLLDQYQKHLKLHKIKTNIGTIETILIASADILENIVKLNFGKMVKGIFSLKHREVALLEGELTSPGKEVAYIVKAKDKLS